MRKSKTSTKHWWFSNLFYDSMKNSILYHKEWKCVFFYSERYLIKIYFSSKELRNFTYVGSKYFSSENYVENIHFSPGNVVGLDLH
jgi:hypothetical protein